VTTRPRSESQPTRTGTFVPGPTKRQIVPAAEIDFEQCSGLSARDRKPNETACPASEALIRSQHSTRDTSPLQQPGMRSLGPRPNEHTRRSGYAEKTITKLSQSRSRHSAIASSHYTRIEHRRAALLIRPDEPFASAPSAVNAQQGRTHVSTAGRPSRSAHLDDLRACITAISSNCDDHRTCPNNGRASIGIREMSTDPPGDQVHIED